MAEKDRNSKNKAGHNPFKALKGFVVGAEQGPEKPRDPAGEAVAAEDTVDFAERMTRFGVERMTSDEDFAEPEVDGSQKNVLKVTMPPESTEEQVFLDAMRTLNVHFEDHLPEPAAEKQASPRRMKRLQKGDITPDATLDLHGVLRSEVDNKLRHFLHNAVYHNARVVLVITGKGLHSKDGEPVVREEVERFLATDEAASVVEWGRAPRQFGGAGALVLFLR